MSVFFSWFATTIIAFLNFNTAMVLVPGDWDNIKVWFAFPISFIACLLFDHTVSEEYSRERLRRFAESTLKWINSQKERLSQSRLGKIRLEAYLYLHGLFESPFLEPSKLSIINRIWCGIYLITEFIVGATARIRYTLVRHDRTYPSGIVKSCHWNPERTTHCLPESSGRIETKI
jgi:hypothetical protein